MEEQDIKLLEQVKDKVLQRVMHLLREEDEFLPFGLLINTAGEIRLLSIDEESEEYTVDQAVSQLKKHIDHQVNSNEQILCGSFAQDFLVNENDAVYLNMQSKNSEGWLSCYIPYEIKEDRNINFTGMIVAKAEE